MTHNENSHARNQNHVGFSFQVEGNGGEMEMQPISSLKKQPHYLTELTGRRPCRRVIKVGVCLASRGSSKHPAAMAAHTTRGKAARARRERASANASRALEQGNSHEAFTAIMSSRENSLERQPSHLEEPSHS
eukprot:scaffold186148_cov27-Tisochrysis_lutea.AAC.4